MSETIEKAREKQRVLFEGQTRFAEIKTEFFEDLMDIQRQPENLSCSDYCRIGFSHGYLEGYEKAKEETQPETKTGNPMPEILPGYVVSYNNLEWTVTKKYSGGRFDIYRDRKRISVGHQDKITRVWDLDGILVWSKE